MRKNADTDSIRFLLLLLQLNDLTWRNYAHLVNRFGREIPRAKNMLASVRLPRSRNCFSVVGSQVGRTLVRTGKDRQGPGRRARWQGGGAEGGGNDIGALSEAMCSGGRETIRVTPAQEGRKEKRWTTGNSLLHSEEDKPWRAPSCLLCRMVGWYLAP